MPTRRMRILTVLLLCFSFTCSYAQEHAEDALQVASIFQDHMVLQRDLPVSIWGQAKAGSKITLLFAKQAHTATVDKDGNWKLQLSPLDGSYSPQSMSISSSDKQKIVLNDIVVGEVWICSGQSNMDMGMNRIEDIKNLQQTAKHIRSLTVSHAVALSEQKSIQDTWQLSIPDSAVAFSFAYFLQQRADVPVGIILSAWGSSSIEAWMPRDLTKQLPYFNTIMQEFDKDTDRIATINEILSGPKPWSKKDDVFLRRQPNILFNAMMKPIAPYTVRGFAWYQGERNTQSMHGLVKEPWFHNNSGILKYKEALQAWINRYRQEWNYSDMHFLLVMLPRYNDLLSTSPTDDMEHPSAHTWAWMRESQLAAQGLENVAVVNTIDLGHPTNIHPLDKLPIGQRLANMAARDTLHHAIEAQGPVLNQAVVSVSNITLHFDHDEGLRTTNGENPTEFWLANDSQQWAKADAKIINNTVVVSSLYVQNPRYVRYSFSAFPNVNLINAAGLPAQPFRTDNFEP